MLKYRIISSTHLTRVIRRIIRALSISLMMVRRRVTPDIVRTARPVETVVTVRVVHVPRSVYTLRSDRRRRSGHDRGVRPQRSKITRQTGAVLVLNQIIPEFFGVIQLAGIVQSLRTAVQLLFWSDSVTMDVGDRF